MADIDISFRPNNNMSLLLLQQKGFTASTVLDIGAAEAGFFGVRSNLGLFPSARHFFVDAMEENEPTYRKLAAKFKTGHEITALSCLEGEVVMRIDPDFYNTHVDHLQPSTDYSVSRRVPVTTLDRLVERHALPAPYVLKLDVQGGELDVLRGGLRTLNEAVIVTTEIQIFSERDSLVDLLGFMQGIGWVLYDITNLAYYPSDSTLYQCYATFIPRAMDFRKNTPWCAPEQKEGILGNLRGRRAKTLSEIERLLG
jgi:FkbM family methyltransferase